MSANGVKEKSSRKENKIFMWINPRSLSTSFEKCIGFMDNAQTWHEPYTSCYFNLLFNDPEVFAKFPQMKAFLGQFVKAQKVVEAGGHLYEGGNLTAVSNFTYVWFNYWELSKQYLCFFYKILCITVCS